MSQEAQTLVSITNESPTTTVRKLKRFRSNSSSVSSSFTTSSQTLIPNPTTPPNPPDSSVLPNSTPPPSTPPPTTPIIATETENGADTSTEASITESLQSEQDKEGSTDPVPEVSSLPTRRILKIPKSAKIKPVVEEPTPAANTTTPPKAPVTTLFAATMRPDGTWRKEIRGLERQRPKALTNIRASAEADTKQEKQEKQEKQRPSKRLRPNSSAIKRLVASAERHNINLANGTGEESKEEDSTYDDLTDDEEEMSFEDQFDHDSELSNSDGGDGGDGEDEAATDAAKEQVANILATAERGLKKQSHYILQQMNNMRKLEGIRVIKNLAKMYGLSVVIPDEEEILRKNLLGEKTKKPKTETPETPARIVKTVGRIGYNAGD